MNITTVYLSEKDAKFLNMLVADQIFPSRSEAMRTAIREGIHEILEKYVKDEEVLQEAEPIVDELQHIKSLCQESLKRDIPDPVFPKEDSGERYFGEEFQDYL